MLSLKLQKEGNEYLHSCITEDISTVQDTCEAGLSASMAYLRSSPVTKSQGVPWNFSKN